MKKQYKFKLTDWLIIPGVAFAFVITFSGCASATPRYDAAGNLIGIDGYGFLRDLEVKQVKADGSSFEIKSKSTSADIVRAGNELMGTVVNAGAKAIP